MKNLVNVVALIMVIGAVFSLNVYSQSNKIFGGEDLTIINGDENASFEGEELPPDKPSTEYAHEAQILL